MKIIYNKLIPIKGFVAVNLFGVIFTRNEYMPISDKTINHEAIHTRQILELFFVFFYLWYSVEWLIRLVQYRSTKEAYRNISFERDAYAQDSDHDYLKNRKPYSFLRYNKKEYICK